MTASSDRSRLAIGGAPDAVDLLPWKKFITHELAGRSLAQAALA
jgi:hypothetical protein